MFKQLIVHDDGEELEAWTRVVEQALGPGAAVAQALNLERALRAVESGGDQWSLVVLHATARANAYAKGRRNCAAACDFVKEIKKREPNLPVIAITSSPCPQLSGLLQAWPDTATLQVDMETPAMLGRLSSELSRGAVDLLAQTLELELRFTSHGECHWRLASHGRWNERARGAYAVDQATIDDLHWMAEPRADGSFLDWMERHSRKMGQFVFQARDPASQAFWRQFVDWRARVGGIRQTRIRMSAQDAHLQDMVLEALKDSEEDRNFWMLEAPIIREYDRGRGSQDLFVRDRAARRPINALVILSDCGARRRGSARLPAEMQPPLEQARAEATAILALMAHAGPDTVLHAEVLVLDGHDLDIARTLQARLAAQRWDLVHFIGHGLVEDQQAQLVLAVEDEEVVRQAFATFAAQLQDTRFLFLSCCRGGSRGFLAQAARQMVPTTLGYRWEVDDEQAREFAEDFYTALFDRGRRSFQSIEYAFVEARAAAFRRHANGVTWASPLLMTQFAPADA